MTLFCFFIVPFYEYNYIHVDQQKRYYMARGCDITYFAILTAVAAPIGRCVHYNPANLQKSVGCICLHELRCHIRTAASSVKDK
jgi:hypothetical protein